MLADPGPLQEQHLTVGTATPKARGERLARLFWLLLALELVVSRYVDLDDIGCNTVVVANEIVSQPGTGKVGFGLRCQRLRLAPLDSGEQLTTGESKFDHARAPGPHPFINPDILSQDFGGHLHGRALSVRDFAGPMLPPSIGRVAASVGHFSVGSELRGGMEGPRLRVCRGILKSCFYFQVAEINAMVPLRHA